VLLSGEVHKAPETRYSPAGIPITRFVLQHQSRQMEAGLPREVNCRIVVVAAGEEMAQRAGALQPGDEVRIRGFLSRNSHRDSEARLVLHAQAIDSSRREPAGQ
jgi:primosomal replication protein N